MVTLYIMLWAFNKAKCSLVPHCPLESLEKLGGRVEVKEIAMATPAGSAYRLIIQRYFMLYPQVSTITPMYHIIV